MKKTDFPSETGRALANVSESKMNPAINHIPALDGIRGIAIILVLAVHMFYRGPDLSIQNYFSEILIFGWTGVELFFVLSGFLITSILLNQKNSPTGYKDFLINRAARIFPLYFLVLLLLLLVSFINLPQKAHTPLINYRENWHIYWLYLSNAAEFFEWDISQANTVLGPVWSLAIEQHFYIIWPIIVLGLKRKHAKFILLSAYLLSLLGRLLLANKLDPIVFYHFTPFHFDGLAVGSILALWLPQFEKLSQFAGRATLISALLMASVFILAGTTHYKNNIIQVVGFPIISIFYGCLILFGLASTRMQALLSKNTLVKIGKYSYFIYLVHWPILLILDQFALPPGMFSWLLFFVSLTIIFTYMGEVSWRFFEKPMASFIRNPQKQRSTALNSNGTASDTTP